MTRVCNSLWETSDIGKLSLRFKRLLHLIGIPDRVQAWNDGDGIQALGCRKSLRDHCVLVCFQENQEGHWDELQLSKKIRIQERGLVKTLAFVGHVDRGPRSILSLRSSEWVLTSCKDEEVVQTGTISEHPEFQLEREGLAQEDLKKPGMPQGFLSSRCPALCVELGMMLSGRMHPSRAFSGKQPIHTGLQETEYWKGRSS